MITTSIATVCIAGTLTQKLHAIAEAGFDGVEIMDSDLVAAYESPEEIRELCSRLGLRIDLFQPIRDLEGVAEDEFAENLRRLREKCALMRRLDVDLLLLCSNVATATVSDDATLVRQLGEIADAAAEFGVRVAYEALAWGRFVNDYRHAWRLVEQADRANLGVCLDSFHILSRGHDPSEIEAIPAEKIYFLQLADAPALDLDVLSWSRHYRLFPGEGNFDLVRFLGHVQCAGYAGPLSLEVFNDTFRQTDPFRTARHARGALAWLADQTARANGWQDGVVTAAQLPSGFDFIEVASGASTRVDETLAQLGFTFVGPHRAKRARLWQLGDARIVVNDDAPDARASLRGFGLLVPDAQAAINRSHELGATEAYRHTYPGDQRIRAINWPDDLETYFVDQDASATWQREFGSGAARAADTAAIDHVNLVFPWTMYDEARLFASAQLNLATESQLDVPGPVGLVRSTVMRTADGAIRIPLNLEPNAEANVTPHVAIAVPDALAVARSAQAQGMQVLPIPANYYDDLHAKFALEPAFLAELQALNVLYDRDARGEFVHFYTQAVGGLFFEIVERRSEYDGFGAANAPVRLAAQQSLLDWHTHTR